MHAMNRVGRDESGMEKWLCPQCGRQLLLRRPPQFKRTVLTEGDSSVQHTGSTGLASMSGVTVDSSDQQWLRQNGIDG